ncbi:MAG: hypothetical protein JW862_19110 [Anaerolineales bacterium]|nr:hypothetical protein [Anaerolineales bacterium]
MKTFKNILLKTMVALAMTTVLLGCGLSAGADSPATPSLTLTPTPLTGAQTPTPTPATGAQTLTPPPEGSGPALTPTTTDMLDDLSLPPTETGPDPCAGLGGAFELQVLIGPSEAVGLEPVAIGSIPFEVVSEAGVYRATGSGAIAYQDTLESEWGTYTVAFDLEASLEGTCRAEGENGILDVRFETSGTQDIELTVGGYQVDYPWEASYVFDFSVPIVEGASYEGEGYVFILRLAE